MRQAALISLAVLMSLGLAPGTMGAADKAPAVKGGPPPPRASAAAPRPQEAPLTAAPMPKTAPTTAPAADDIAPDEDKPEEKGKMEPKEETNRGTALPIPRFVSLRTDPINLRTGPGVRYPVEWVYVRRRLPVEVIAEFDTWRQIRDPDGAEGWVHQTMLSGRRTAMVKTAAVLRRDGADSAAELANVEKGVIVSVQRCPAGGEYCRVDAGGIQGWLKRDRLWGVYPTETVQ